MLCAVAGSVSSEPATAQQLHTSVADSLVARARAAAWRDANAKSAALFADALQRAPSRRSEWLREYADQLTYSDRADAAIPLYREALARPGMSIAEERRTRLGLALALSWDGNLRASLA